MLSGQHEIGHSRAINMPTLEIQTVKNPIYYFMKYYKLNLTSHP